MVYTRKAAKLKDTYKVGVWQREVRDGKIFYTVNLEHPLIQDALESVPTKKRTKIESSLRMIANSFPCDLYYNDAADDDLELSVVNEDSDSARNLCIQLIAALKACGLSGSDLKKKIMQTEVPGATNDLKESLLNEVKNNG